VKIKVLISRKWCSYILALFISWCWVMIAQIKELFSILIDSYMSAGVMPNMSHCQITRSTIFAWQVGIIKPNPNPTTNPKTLTLILILTLTLTEEINKNLHMRLCVRSRMRNGTDASCLALRDIWYYTSLFVKIDTGPIVALITSRVCSMLCVRLDHHYQHEWLLYLLNSINA